MRYGVSLFWEECTQTMSSLNFESDVYIEDYDKRKQDCRRRGGGGLNLGTNERDGHSESKWLGT